MVAMAAATVILHGYTHAESCYALVSFMDIGTVWKKRKECLSYAIKFYE